MEPAHNDVLAFLDDLQAAEHAGAAALARWIGVCGDPMLRGGLRVLRARDEAHAALALARLHELGGHPRHGVSPGLDALCGVLGSRGVSDRAKLGMLLARFPPGAGDPLARVVAPGAEDDETHALLDTIRCDDRLSVEWLRTADAAPPVVPRERIGAGERAEVVAFLEALHAATSGAVEVAGAWAAVCPSAGLRGGLRAIARRTAAHAVLLEQRLREVGGVPGSVALSQATLAGARRRYGSPEVADGEKLASLLDRAPDGPTPVQAIETFAAALVEDVETREILRGIAAGDATTVAWLGAYREAVPDRARGRSAPA